MLPTLEKADESILEQMSEREDITELIERYLDGDLTPEESEDFRNRLNHNPTLTREVDLHKEMREGIAVYGERQDLRAELEQMHKNMEQVKVKPIAEPKANSAPKNDATAVKVVSLRTLYRVSAVAASVAILLSVSITMLVNTSGDQAENNTIYLPMSKESAMDMVQSIEVDSTTEDAATATEPGDRPRPQSATAFAISENGYLVTTGHFALGARRVFIDMGPEAGRMRAEVVEADSELDLAILKITDERFEDFGRLPYIFDGDDAQLGEEVFTVGFPKNELVYGHGAISAINGYRDTIDYQISVPLNPGNSGGPLVNDKGEIIGIVIGKKTNEDGAAYATKAKYFLEFVEPYTDKDSADPVKLSRKNYLRGKKRPDQIEKMRTFVFEASASY